jgi:hypothetical protein
MQATQDIVPESQRRGRSKNPLPRFVAKVDVGVCMEWTAGKTPDGYGRFEDCGRLWLSHRWIWSFVYGPIPEGLTVDHLCRNPACVDPTHLRLAPMLDNIRAGYSPAMLNARKTHCKWGHEFTAPNTLPASRGKGRKCRTCKQKRERERRLRVA